jgi:hypothetical protein
MRMLIALVNARLVGSLADTCIAGLCSAGRLDVGLQHCCSDRCAVKCGGPGCGAADNIAGPDLCCPARWVPNGSSMATCTAVGQTSCRMPKACASLATGKSRERTPRSSKRPAERGSGGVLAASAAARAAVECRCHGAYTHAYRGSCLPSFMVIGSQKAATSKLRWYLSRHPSIDIPKEEAFHGGPHAVAAWDTKENPTLLSSYLEAFEDVCNSTERITGLKMPDYIVMSAKTIELFHIVNPQLRIIVTLREPIARMYSYFSMQLRFGWSPINHMGKNPCMQRSLRALLKAKEAQVAAGVPPAGAQGPNRTAVFTSEEIMMTNLLCVRPCYAGNASGLGAAAQTMTWHDESKSECRNIYFTPLVHSMYALHLRRWLATFARNSLLLVRFDDLVLRPLETLKRIGAFLGLPPFVVGFKVEIGRENYTTISRLLQSGAVTETSLRRLQAFFAPHDAALSAMFGGSTFW